MKLNNKKTLRNDSWLSGWLSPEGYFMPASHGNHDELAKDLEIKNIVSPIFDNIISNNFIHGERLLELSGYIKFTYRQLNKNLFEAFVFFPQQMGYSKDVTSNQIDWLESNYHQMSNLQRERVRLYLQFAYNR